MSEEMVLVTLIRFQELQDSELFLNALESVGVDNWEGYEDAIDIYEEEKSK